MSTPLFIWAKGVSSCLLRISCSVQLYTLDRGYPGNDLKPATEKALMKIKKLVEEAGLSAQIF